MPWGFRECATNSDAERDDFALSKSVPQLLSRQGRAIYGTAEAVP
jgi:hypothetical protein